MVTKRRPDEPISALRGDRRLSVVAGNRDRRPVWDRMVCRCRFVGCADVGAPVRPHTRWGVLAYVFRSVRPTARQHVALAAWLESHRELYNAALQERRDACVAQQDPHPLRDCSAAQLTEIRAARWRSGGVGVLQSAGHAAAAQQAFATGFGCPSIGDPRTPARLTGIARSRRFCGGGRAAGVISARRPRG